ncbi:hypothetical protein pb186bvf_004170 [Paramecium bursaria]
MSLNQSEPDTDIGKAKQVIQQIQSDYKKFLRLKEMPLKRLQDMEDYYFNQYKELFALICLYEELVRENDENQLQVRRKINKLYDNIKKPDFQVIENDFKSQISEKEKNKDQQINLKQFQQFQDNLNVLQFDQIKLARINDAESNFEKGCELRKNLIKKQVEKLKNDQRSRILQALKVSQTNLYEFHQIFNDFKDFQILKEIFLNIIDNFSVCRKNIYFNYFKIHSKQLQQVQEGKDLIEIKAQFNEEFYKLASIFPIQIQLDSEIDIRMFQAIDSMM